MKKFFTLCVLVIATITSKAQVVLNELYPEPGGTTQEFFELYNTSTSQTPESLDNYTIVVYYEEAGNKSGFYVFDLPNQPVAAKNFFVASSQNVFNIQGQSNITANLNWNTLGPDAAITKWQKSGSSYIQVATPAPLTDFFVKITGTNVGVYNILIYKNGMLVNGLIIGSNANVFPATIKAMPNLFVDMTGSSPDFTINFNTIADNNVEYVSANSGNDNGYYRQYDGKCGVWVKSSSGADYTPGRSNGSAADVLGSLTINATISSYVQDPNRSLLTYNVSAGPADAFPVLIQVYQDLGIIGELDANDVLVDSKNIANASMGDQQVVMPTATDGAIVVAKAPSGCYDKVMVIPNPFAKTLPVHLISFQGNMNKNNKVTLNWTIADNEIANSFEVERSTNGRDFSTVAVVFASEKIGTENYMFYETYSATEKVMYRLKMIDKNKEADYSKILVFGTKTIVTNDIKIIGNPVNDKLTFSYTSTATQQVSIRVYDISGKIVLNNKMNSLDGNNLVSLPLSSTFTKGMYIVEVNDGAVIKTAKFIKQ